MAGKSYSANAVAAMESTGGALAAPAGTGFECVRCTSDNCSEGSDGEKTSEAGEHSAGRGDDVRLRGDLAGGELFCSPSFIRRGVYTVTPTLLQSYTQPFLSMHANANEFRSQDGEI